MVLNISNKLLVGLSLAFISFAATAQQQNDFSVFRDSLINNYQGFRSGVYEDYHNYRKQVNEQYLEFINTVWDKSEINEGIQTPFDSHPVVPPIFYERDGTPSPGPGPVVEVSPRPWPAPAPQPSPTVTPRNDNTTVRPKFEIEFYGTPVRISKPKLGFIPSVGASNEDITRVWQQLADGRTDALLADCIEMRTKLNLNDWAYLELLQNIGESLSSDINLRTLVVSYLFSNTGYKMRLGRQGTRLVMLFATENLIYRTSYYTLQGERYYPLTTAQGTIEICPAQFPAERPMSMLISALPKFSVKESQVRELHSKEGMDITSEVNENLIEFYNNYPAAAVSDTPVSRWAINCNAPLSETAVSRLYPQLTSRIQNLDNLQKVNAILNFVQTAFDYEYDDVVWGGDRAFFAEETLFYPYADCEDRTALFTRLVRDLTGLSCAIVYYPGHLAAAVNFPDNSVNGAKIRIDGKEYIICDPTYINAPVGSQMPKLDTSKVEAYIL